MICACGSNPFAHIIHPSAANDAPQMGTQHMAQVSNLRSQDLSSVVSRLNSIGKALGSANSRTSIVLTTLAGSGPSAPEGVGSDETPVALVSQIHNVIDKLEAEICRTDSNADRLARIVTDGPINTGYENLTGIAQGLAA